MMNCKEVARLLAEERALGVMGRLEMRFHLLVCRSCSSFARQLAALRKGFGSFINKKGGLNEAETKKLEDKVLKELDQ